VYANWLRIDAQSISFLPGSRCQLRMPNLLLNRCVVHEEAVEIDSSHPVAHGLLLLAPNAQKKALTM